MSLVNQFEITLKDFLPDLRAYAEQKQLRLSQVVTQLRDEIHRN
jgi:hypothetical protein